MSRLVFKHINQQINAILSMDSEVIQQLTELGSCYLSLHISPFKDPFYLKLIDGKATLSGSKPRSPIDIEIHGSISSIAELIQKNFSIREMDEPIEISGNIATLSKIKHIIDTSPLGIESILAHYTSAWFAQWAIDSHLAVQSHLKRWCQNRLTSFYEYAIYEEKWIVSRESFDTLLETYHELSQRVDDIERQLNNR